jgi:hypothetical protein
MAAEAVMVKLGLEPSEDEVTAGFGLSRMYLLWG